MNKDINILITGITGYIGSHTAVELLNKGYTLIGLDNFSNSKKETLNNISKITCEDIIFYEGDMADKELLRKIFSTHKIDVVIDFAAYKAVGDSVIKPIEYYQNNVSSVISLLEVMKEFSVKSLIFSSSATVYGNPDKLPITEECITGGTTNPYGRSKFFVEKILEDLYTSDKSNNICIFRYFNPVGSHKSGLIGEDPKGKPANLMPFICKVATKELDVLEVFGDDYDTVDGTGIRDYIHVVDLAIAHVKGVEKLIASKSGFYVYNLGTGQGISVLEIIKAFEEANNLKLNYKISKRRPGDIDACYADCSKAIKELNWKPTMTTYDMCKDAFKFYFKN